MQISLNKLLVVAILLLMSCQESNGDLFDKAYKLTKEAKFDQAIPIYNQLIKRNKKLQLPYYNRGYCYFSLKKYDKALFDYNKVIDLQTTIGGFIYIQNNEGPLASEESQYQVSYYDALYQRAQVHFYLNNNEESFKDFRTLIANDYEEKGNCYLWLGSLKLNSGDSAKACEYLLNAKMLANTEEVRNEAEKMLKTFCKTYNNR